MRVKIENTLYNSADEPIMLILDSREKLLIGHMGEQTEICVVPESYTEDQTIWFMKEKTISPGAFQVPTFILNWVIPGILVFILLTILLH